MKTVIQTIFLSAIVSTGLAQETPFLNDVEIRMLINELSGDRAFEQIRVLTQWHRDSGMDGYFKAADFVVDQARKAGLEDVHFVEQPLEGPNYTAIAAELWMTEPISIKLADIGDHALYLADGSHDADVTAELVWGGTGSKADLEHSDVKGKIVLVSGSPGQAVANAVWEKGAVGVVSYTTSESKSALDFPDQLAWTRIPVTPPAGKEGTFAFNLSPRKGEKLKSVLETHAMQDIFATGKKSMGGKIVLKAKVDTEIGMAPGRTGFVEGWIKGSKYHDQQIVLTAHLQEEQGSANDDGSGSANLLEIARTLNKLIDEGKMQRPLRDIRFWWTDEIYSEYRYFRDNPNEPSKMLVNLHQDMVGAKQSVGSRIQHLIYAPHSITSYLDALFESVGTFVVNTNNPFITAGRMGGYPRPHARAIYATRGTHESFGARFIPYFNASDNMNFVEGVIGVPAVALINWDDYYIHSSDDDLWQIDATQLQRNAFIIAAMTYYLGKAEKDQTNLLLAETYAQGSKRLANDLQVALKEIQTNSDKTEGWKNANLVVEQGILREVRALNSITSIASNDATAKAAIAGAVGQMKPKQQALVNELSEFYKRANAVSKVPAIKPNAEESMASKKIPSNSNVLDTYFGKRKTALPGSTLHPTMAPEVLNFVDGKRSYYDIYKAVKAESLAAGSWYYGTVLLDDVVRLLDANVEAGALVLE
ncbi:MAG: M28 family metallopeptidase [Cyclobacteriaceae bacterium]|nr:M28 family metallopeptidase [Cyclobacteriaceae bacterium]MDH4296167.1 M28 family metallopeptidase [Cyclobacteriaceae bacterium]MDH5249928.1 M28 family metallopeptidase [Cyclobacteriaceae bacterium]